MPEMIEEETTIGGVTVKYDTGNDDGDSGLIHLVQGENKVIVTTSILDAINKWAQNLQGRYS